tara:strand:+ start:990 stop:1196 length:207 start_codon:yes stop_codon:yes gene_type:complete
MITKIIEVALESKTMGDATLFTPEEMFQKQLNKGLKPMKIPKYVKEYFNNRKKYQQPRKANKSVGDST